MVWCRAATVVLSGPVKEPNRLLQFQEEDGEAVKKGEHGGRGGGGDVIVF